MCDEDINQGLVYDPRLAGPGPSRRSFGLMAAAVGLAATAAHAAGNVVEKDVVVKTGDGMADSAIFYPAGKGKWPAVLLWTDIMGLRPVFRDMARRLAGEGYVVLVPNVYYRTKPAPVVGATFEFPKDRALLPPPPAADAVDRDAVAFLAFLDTQPQVDKTKKAGVQGYCMGGPYTFRTAAILPDRIGAAATFHGGGIGAATPNSPYLLLPQTKAEFLCCVAQNDDKTDPEAKNRLNTAFDTLKRPHHVEVYAADHGWTVPGSAVYNQAEAERAYAALLPVYKRNLA
jgi:carboxymethylenebutenolidase